MELKWYTLKGTRQLETFISSFSRVYSGSFAAEPSFPRFFIRGKILSKESPKPKHRRGTVIYFLIRDRSLSSAWTKCYSPGSTDETSTARFAVRVPLGKRWNIAKVNNKANNVRYDNSGLPDLSVPRNVNNRRKSYKIKQNLFTIRSVNASSPSIFDKFKGYFDKRSRALSYRAITLSARWSVQNLSNDTWTLARKRLTEFALVRSIHNVLTLEQ